VFNCGKLPALCLVAGATGIIVPRASAEIFHVFTVLMFFATVREFLKRLDVRHAALSVKS